MRLIMNTASPSPLGIEDTSIIYHYTNMQALLSILNPDGIVLWATHHKYLNDKDEIQKGFEVMSGLFAIDRTVLKNVFILALSRSVDDITMWLNYSNGYNGCILGFKNNKIGGNRINCFYGKDSAKKYYSNNIRLLEKGSVTNISYFSTYKNEGLSAELYQQIVNFSGIAAIIGYKDEAFKYENETRIFINLQRNDFKHIKYRSKNGVIIPYIECQFGKEVLSEIWIPNNEKTEMNRSSLQNMLYNYGFEDVEIKVSKSPYRNI